MRNVDPETKCLSTIAVRQPIIYEVRIELENIGVRITKRRGLEHTIDVDGNITHAKHAIDGLIMLLEDARKNFK